MPGVDFVLIKRWLGLWLLYFVAGISIVCGVKKQKEDNDKKNPTVSRYHTDQYFVHFLERFAQVSL